MIAKTTSSPRFFPLADYLAAGIDGRHPERVQWTAGRRLAAADLTVAPAIMEATAYQSARVELPCYHIVVSFDPRDQPGRSEMEQVADRILGRLGLAEHQALYVAHNDRPCAHVHMMVNRVHPETGVAWERWKDRHLIEAALRQAERDLGLRQVPGRLSPALDQERSVPQAREPDLTWGERRLANRTGRRPLLERARDALNECRQAKSWAELGAALAEHGLEVVRTTRGIVFTDGHTRVRASRVAPDLGLPRLEARFAERLPDSQSTPGVERTVALVRLLVAGEALERIVRDAAADFQRVKAQLTAVQVSARQSRALLDQLKQAFDGVYVDPTGARVSFASLEREHGTVQACALLADAPAEVGALRTAAHQRVARVDGRAEKEGNPQTIASFRRLARDATRAAEVMAAMPTESVAQARVESASARAHTTRDRLAQLPSRHLGADKMRQQLLLAVSQVEPEGMSVLRRLLTPIALELVRSAAAADREIHAPQERSR